MVDIRKAAVLGAGVMGSGIAAHLANAGIEVVLLDIERATAAAGLARQQKIGGFMDPAFATRIVTGSVTEDLSLIADADWIIEAVAERLDVKQPLYRRVDAVRAPGSIVSSNTSTFRLATLTDGQSPSFAEDFLVTHFFNPPRSMRLLELVAGPRTRPEAVETIRDFGDRRLGKAVVVCRDTPGFIANRIGNYWMSAAVNEAIALDLDVEVADATLSKPFGIPGTGIFGLADLVGIDVVALVWKSLHAALPETDALRRYPAAPELVSRMIAENRLGRKTGAGFVRVSADRKTREVTDLGTGAYRPQKPVESDSLAAAGKDPRALMEHEGPAGRYAAAVMEKTLAYVAEVAPEIAEGPDAVDTAMCTGYGWSEGPFALIDRLGAGWLAARLAARDAVVPPYLAQAAAAGGFFRVEDGARLCLLPDGSWREVAKAPGVLTLAALRLAQEPVEEWEQASLWDLGDGVACFEIRSKMNTLNPAVLSALEAALDRATRDFRALVIGSDAPNFSAGADIRQFLEAVEAGIEGFGERVDQGHRLFKALKYAPIPVVGAAAGLALGGGCELLLHCSAIQAHAELTMSLPETRLGLVPSWGGCKELLVRFANGSARVHGPVAPAIAAFDLIASGRMTQSAFEARRLGFLSDADGITMNRDRLLADAKARALALAEDYAPPAAPAVTLSGPSGAAGLRNLIDGECLAGRMTPHDRIVGEVLVGVLTGGAAADPVRPATEDAVTALERRAFLDLLAKPASLDRIRHMAETGKPLRN